MHFDRIKDLFPDARIEIDDNTVYVHSGDSSPLVFTKVEGITDLHRDTYQKYRKKLKKVI
jgi:hypothetical protein